MIPGDLAARLRLLTEASFFSNEPSVAPLARVKSISDRFPDFQPGQRIVAQLQTPLSSSNSEEQRLYKAQVSGRDVTLQLPAALKSGDTLELVVSHVTQQSVVATLAPPTSAATNPTPTPPALSQAAKLIGFLLTGQPTPEPTKLNGGQPILSAPPQTPAATSQLAAQLSSALASSGLFYESHQAHWLAGQLDTARLQAEPQAHLTSAAPPAAATAGQAAPSATPTASANVADSPETPTTPSATRGADAQQPTPIPERLLPLVHQQLEAVATHQMLWQGQIWPGQNMEWEIEDPQADGRGAEEDGEPYWNTTLRLRLPNLGGVEAKLHLTPAGVAVRLIADQDSTRSALDGGRQRLANALEAAGLALTGLVAEGRSATP